MNRLKATLSGLISGVFVGTGAFLFSLIISLPFFDKTFLKLVASFIFPIGLFLICNLKTYLYTGKIGFVIESDKNDRINLIFIYLGNIIGIAVFAILLRLIVNIFPDNNVISTITNLANNRTVNILETPQNLIKTFSNGIFCGIFVFLAVYSFKQKLPYFTRVVLLFLNVALFVYFGFEHCIANVFYFAFANTISVSIFVNVLIVSIANSLGSLFAYFVIKLSKHAID